MSEYTQLVETLKRLGLYEFVTNAQWRESKRVFVYGALPPYGEMGWIVKEDHSKSNPFYVVTDGVVAGLWLKEEHFKRMPDEQ